MDIKAYTEKHKDDIYLFNQGTFYKAYEMLGAHPAEEDGVCGTRFSVWVPGAKAVAVEGDFNGWSKDKDQLQPVGNSGVWTGFVPGACEGQTYKFFITSKRGSSFDKADPYAFWSEVRPKSASVIRTLSYEWHDAEWLEKRAHTNHFEQPKNIYEVHLGSWKRHTDRLG